MSDQDDDTSRNLLSKADEFLRRRERIGTGLIVGQPRADTPNESDDIPLLTDVVSQAAIAVYFASAKSRNNIKAEISREMAAWLDENLPQVVVHALDGISDRLIAQIHENVRTDLLPRLERAINDDLEADEK